MRNIDERVVGMRFDNKQFESGVKTSLDSLENLKKGLNMDGATRSLSELERAGRGFSFSGLADSVDNISNKFTALGIIGVTALANITNSAVNAGKRIVTALTIDPIKTGFKEYEIKIGAIQTILTNTASKGTTLEDVNKTLNELNEYADKTIYNFAEMTKNIGTFTAAGIELDTAATAIKGIANLAAGSGSTSQQASTAMYQLSQALAAGSVKLMDWNSVVNAGMGGELFQNALKDTAKQMGIVVNESIPFRESLQTGWITAEVLTKTLSKFAEDESLVKAATEVKTLTQMFDTMKESVQSGWAVSWENIIGDKEQSAKTLTAINDAFGALIGPAADARNEMLGFWNVNGGRDAMIEALSTAFKTLGSILKPIKDAFREVFPPMTGERLVEITKRIRDLVQNFKIGEGTIIAIRTTFKGLFSILKIVTQVLGILVKGFMALFGVAAPVGGWFLQVTSSIGEFLTSLQESIEATGIFNSVLEKFKDLLESIPSSFGGFEKVASIFSKVAEAAGKAFDKIKEFVSGFFNGFDAGRTFEIINGGIFALILLGIKKFISNLSTIAKNGGDILGGISGILDGVRGSLEAYQQQLKAGTLLKIAAAIGILALSLVAISMIDPDKLSTALLAIGILFGQLIGSMAIFQKVVTGPGFKSMITITVAMLAMSTAILMLAGAMLIISTLDWNGIAKGLISIGILLAEMLVFMKLFNAGGVTLKSAAGLLLIANALMIMAVAVRTLGGMDILSLTKGLGAIAILLGELLLFMKLSGDSTGLVATAFALSIMATAMLIFAAAIGSLGSMSWKTLAKGLGALAVSLLLMGVAMRFMQGSIAGAAALLLMATAIAVLVPALMLLGTMPIKNIAKALLTLVGVFIILGVAAAVLAPLTPVLLGLAGTIALLGLACLAVGAGLLLFSTALAALAVSGVAGGAALVAIISSIIGLIPYVLKKIGEGIIELAKVIRDGAPAIIDAALTIISEFLNALLEEIPKIVMQGIDMVLALIEGIISKLPEVIQAAFDLVIAFLTGLADAIRNNDDVVIEAVKDLVSAIVEAATNAFKSYFKSFKEVGKNLISGFLSGFRSDNTSIEKAAGDVGEAALKGVRKKLSVQSPSKEFERIGKYANEGLANGLRNFTGLVSTSAKDVGKTAITALSNSIGNIAEILNGNIDLNPTISPVLDLTGIDNGLNSAFEKQRILNLEEIRAKAASFYTPAFAGEGFSGGAAISQPITVNVTGNYIANDYDVTRIADTIAAQLAREQRRNK